MVPSKVINTFAAVGHVGYAKSARLDFQTILDSPDTFPCVHRNFMINGYHTMRRSDKF